MIKNPIKSYVDLYRQEAYVYFDQNIRRLPIDASGQFDESGGGMRNNDADAFRHAYVSGAMTQRWGEKITELLGLVVEVLGRNPEAERNMDLWNNAVGRKYGKKTRSLGDLAAHLQRVLDAGELIVSLNDPRKYEGRWRYSIDSCKPVVVIEETDTGRNQLFFDPVTGDVLDREYFVLAIKNQEYSGYRVALMAGVEIPVSKSDDSSDNNLG